MSCWIIGVTLAADGDFGLSYPNWIKACDTSAAFRGEPICRALDRFDFADLNDLPWTKLCRKEDPNSKQICFTTKEVRNASGVTAITAVLTEPENGADKLFRVMLPLGVQLGSGVRISFDDGSELEASFGICFMNGCIADFKADAALVSSLATARTLTIQALSSNGSHMTLSVTTGSEFRAATEEPARDPELDERANRELKLRQQKASAKPAVSPEFR